MCHSTPAVRSLQQAIPHSCPAKALAPSQRLTMGLQALARTQSVTGLADSFEVSRKFVYQQAATARAALDDAFTASVPVDDKVLFYLPVTKNWLRQTALSLTLTCHSSYRGVVEFCRDLLDVEMSVGTVHNIVRAAIDKARPYNLDQDLANIAIAGLDEIYQNGRPVLVGADIASTYCFLLSLDDHPDSDTWAIRLLEAHDHGLAPEAFVADFGGGIRAGSKVAFDDVPCRGDVFHALAEFTKAMTFLEKRAYDALAGQNKLQQKKDKLRDQARRDQIPQVNSLACRATAAARAADQAVSLADDLALLTRWLRYEVFAVSGLPYADRCALFDFILVELQTRAPLYHAQLNPLCTLLKNHRTQLLAFAAQLDQDLSELAVAFAIPVAVVRELLDLQALNQRQPHYWQKETALRQRLRHRFYQLREAVRALADRTVRASSVIENINSRLRNYFCLRREIGSDYLTLLQFFFNHRRFLRSERPERVGKSPAELLTGQRHLHWLELLGYTRFSKN